MRCLMLVLLFAASPIMALAQTTRIIVTNEDGIKFVKNGKPYQPEDEGGYEVSSTGDFGIKVKTWYGTELVVLNARVVSPDEAVTELTDRIRQTPTDGTQDLYLARLYKYRGIAWRAKLKDEYQRVAEQNLHVLRIGLVGAVPLGGVAPFAALLNPPRHAPKPFARVDLPVGNDVKDFTESMRRNPRQADVYTHRGLSYLQNGKFAQSHENKEIIDGYYESGIDDFDRAIRLDETSAWAFYSRGKARLENWDRKWLDVTKKFNDAADATQKKLAADAVARKNAAGAKKGPSPKEAQKDVDAAQQAFNLADQNFAKVKDAWTLANRDLSQATKDYFEYAARTFNRVDAELVKAQETWTTRRDMLVKAKSDLSQATDDQAKADKKAAEGDTAKKDATDKLTKKKRPFDVAIIDLTDAVDDFSNARRCEPAVDVQVSAGRNRANALVEEARKLLKQYKTLHKSLTKPAADD